MKYILTLVSLSIIIAIGCKKKDSAPPTVPTLTTTAVTNISGSTAQSGGVITDNGGATITASGVCWSKSNNSPTISDDTTRGATTSGSFTSSLKNLQPSGTYYVRAYAINNAGTGYGNVVTFNTGNAAPQAQNITIVGTAAVTNKIKVTYTYFDFENDPMAPAAYQWFIATDTAGGAMGTAINGATDSIYTIAAGDQNKFIRVAITPKATSGASPGSISNSKWIGPIGGEPTSVSFTYNGQTVTYGIIISPVTQKRWLDRNLGASRVATSSDDYLAYGDLFQWGRPADGHQLITWSNSTTGAGVNGITSTKATTDNPGNNLFVTVNTPPNDWRDDNNTNRWAINPQGPCPLGWHVPTKPEWQAETGVTNISTAYDQLKLTASGFRRLTDGNVFAGSFIGIYWSSTLVGTAAGQTSITGGSIIWPNSQNLAEGDCVRCIKD